MNVILLTVFIGLILVGMAIVFFFYIREVSQGSSHEQDSLLPLEEDIPPQNPKPSSFPLQSNQKNPAKH